MTDILFQKAQKCLTHVSKIPIQNRPLKLIFKKQDFPGGTVVKNPPANAGDTGSSPGPGRSHVPQSYWARVPQLLKPVRLEPVLHNKRSHRNEKPAHCNEL